MGSKAKGIYIGPSDNIKIEIKKRLDKQTLVSFFVICAYENINGFYNNGRLPELV